MEVTSVGSLYDCSVRAFSYFHDAALDILVSSIQLFLNLFAFFKLLHRVFFSQVSDGRVRADNQKIK